MLETIKENAAASVTTNIILNEETEHFDQNFHLIRRDRALMEKAVKAAIDSFQIDMVRRLVTTRAKLSVEHLLYAFDIGRIELIIPLLDILEEAGEISWNLNTNLITEILSSKHPLLLTCKRLHRAGCPMPSSKVLRELVTQNSPFYTTLRWLLDNKAFTLCDLHTIIEHVATKLARMKKQKSGSYAPICNEDLKIRSLRRHLRILRYAMIFGKYRDA